MTPNDQFIRERFARYYAGVGRDFLSLPPRYSKREYGFIHFAGDFFDRHRKFDTRAAVADFLAATAPRHAYHSVAYYQDPGARSMKEKYWLGADLVFDLDADHLKGADKLSLEEQLAELKKHTIRLIDNFLIPDFGFTLDEMQIVFSGGRGYHVHVRSEKCSALDSSSRREVVMYVKGTDIAIRDFVTEKTFMVDRFGKEHKKTSTPRASAPGWKGKLARHLHDTIAEIAAMERAKGLKELKKYQGIGPKYAEAIYDKFTHPVSGAMNIEKLNKGDISMFSSDKYLSPIIDGIASAGIESISAETDAPVTGDVKRLIRLPGSLHGKTGLLVKPLSWEELLAFDPLRDAAVLKTTATGTVKVKALVEGAFTLGGETFEMKGEVELPEWAAVFAVGRKLAAVA